MFADLLLEEIQPREIDVKKYSRYRINRILRI